jgi:hypothetical protein
VIKENVQTLKYQSVEHKMKLVRDLDQRTNICGILRRGIMRAPAACTYVVKFDYEDETLNDLLQAHM